MGTKHKKSARDTKLNSGRRSRTERYLDPTTRRCRYCGNTGRIRLKGVPDWNYFCICPNGRTVQWNFIRELHEADCLEVN